MTSEDETLVDIAIRTGEMYRGRVYRWIAGGKDLDAGKVLAHDIQSAVENKKIEGALGQYLLDLIGVEAE
ncbi:MAG: hypothetical protein A2804_02495 [Candidatus Pacebacteria bacterium RIFCSPHIGHO2_01_FULL_46_10]|nr:MAG: hypothetical protein A2804_02495 [Candidatus Pacebacteria bacterium RIFCSPHIGHO2_01_FULL_46_10]